VLSPEACGPASSVVLKCQSNQTPNSAHRPEVPDFRPALVIATKVARLRVTGAFSYMRFLFRDPPVPIDSLCPWDQPKTVVAGTRREW